MSGAAQTILDLIDSRLDTWTPGEILRHLSETRKIPARQARRLIAELVESGRLTYRDRFGRTVLMPGLDRPLSVSPRLVLSGPDAQIPEGPDRIVVWLREGPAFGDGCHPTTRLCLRGMDFVLKTGFRTTGDAARVLDVGTGSGVLAIAALKLGLGRGVGLDIDPWAIQEARENARLNGLLDRFQAESAGLERIAGPFALILANLRWPTLKVIEPDLVRLLDPEGNLVVSGIQADEADRMRGCFSRDLRPLWQSTEKGWSAMIWRLRPRT